MAISTQKNLRNQVMYQVFVRNFSEEGTFAAVQGRLDEIKALGTDIIWFMPIHPIGKQMRKGTLGSPYAISDGQSRVRQSLGFQEPRRGDPRQGHEVHHRRGL